MRTGITFGTFDVFHYGHLRILERAREMCDRLVVGVSSDELNFSKKNRYPYYTYEERARIVGALRCVDEVFREDALELKELKTVTGALKELQGLWEEKGGADRAVMVLFEGETEEMSV